jgi:hypothetical protein
MLNEEQKSSQQLIVNTDSMEILNNKIDGEAQLRNLFKTINTIKKIRLIDVLFSLKKRANMMIAYWIIKTSSNTELHKCLEEEHKYIKTIIDPFSFQNEQISFVSLTAYIYAHTADYIFFQEIIEKYIYENKHNELSNDKLNYLINYMDEECYSHLSKIQLSIQIKQGKDDILEEGLATLILKTLIKKVVDKSNLSFFYSEKKFEDTSKKSSFSRRSRKSSNKNEQRQPLRALKRSDSIILKNSNNCFIKLNVFYYNRLERILIASMGNKNKNFDILKILLNNVDFSLVFFYLSKESLQRIIMPSVTNFSLFFKKQYFNVAFYILSYLEPQSLQNE